MSCLRDGKEIMRLKRGSEGRREGENEQLEMKKVILMKIVK